MGPSATDRPNVCNGASHIHNNRGVRRELHETQGLEAGREEASDGAIASSPIGDRFLSNVVESR